MSFFFHLGRYFLLLRKAFARPEKQRLYLNLLVREIYKLGISSIWLVLIISFFMGAVITYQTAYNATHPLFPKYFIGLGTRDSMILEFSCTMVGLILAGKIGSNITSEIGSMRISEQIDALEIMGINSASYLILPKIVATMLFNPFLTTISIFVGIVGGYLVALTNSALTPFDYIYGIQYWFIPYYITYSMVKTIVFAFIITTISAYQGYYTQGGALDVGRSSTRAVVYSSILILIFNLIITQLML